ncbi:MAG: purine/pyrimidine permease [Peptoniphilaceae bacterium]|nr:purine/pyrimidine permease [Peptoniphilaceae bacterium]
MNIKKENFFDNLLMAFQHVLVMNAYIVPVVIASSLNLSNENSSNLIQSTFLVSGIATLLQSIIFMKNPVIYGAFFVTVGSIIGIYSSNNKNPLGTIIFAEIVASIFMVIFGISKSYTKISKKFLTPIVSSTIVLSIGVALVVMGVNQIIDIENNGLEKNILISIFTFSLFIFFSILGGKNLKISKFFSITSAILAVSISILVFRNFFEIDFTNFNNSKIISIPKLAFLDYKLNFDLSSIFTMIIIYAVVLTENTGTWIMTENATNLKIKDSQYNKGIIGSGVVNIISAIFGSTAISAFSSNVGIISISKMFSDKIFKYAGIILILIGFSSKLSSLIAIIPSPIISGIFLAIASVVAESGIEMFKNIEIKGNKIYVVAIPIMLSIFLNIIPLDILNSFPKILQYIFSSSIATSAIFAILLDKIIK